MLNVLVDWFDGKREKKSTSSIQSKKTVPVDHSTYDRHTHTHTFVAE